MQGNGYLINIAACIIKAHKENDVWDQLVHMFGQEEAKRFTVTHQPTMATRKRRFKDYE